MKNSYIKRKYILYKIKLHLLNMKSQGIYSFFNSNYAKERFQNGSLKNLEYYYKIFMELDLDCSMYETLGIELEKLFNQENYLFIDRINFSEKDNKNRQISDILLTGSQVEKNKIKNQNKLPIISNFLDLICLMKKSCKEYDINFLYAVPKKMIDEKGYILEKYKDNIYFNIFNDVYNINPDYIVGVFIVKNDECEFYFKDEYLNDFNDKTFKKLL